MNHQSKGSSFYRSCRRVVNMFFEVVARCQRSTSNLEARLALCRRPPPRCCYRCGLARTLFSWYSKAGEYLIVSGKTTRPPTTMILSEEGFWESRITACGQAVKLAMVVMAYMRFGGFPFFFL